MAHCTDTTLVSETECANHDSKSPEAELGENPDICPASSDQEREDGDDGDDADDTDDDYYYESESESEISISSHEGENMSQNELAAGNALEAFRAEWLQGLRLGEEIQGQDARGAEELPHGGSQSDGHNSDGLSVSRLWLGENDNCHQFEDLPSSGHRAAILGQEMDEFEQEQLLQEEMWKYYAENRTGNAPRYIDNSHLPYFC